MECCNIERVKIALKSLGREQLKKIIEEDKKAEVECPYCNQKYYFDQKQLEEILIEAK